MSSDRRREAELKVSEEICKRWNDSNPEGTRVRYYPIAGSSEYRMTRTKGYSFVSTGGHPVIFLEDQSGYVSLEHVKANYQVLLTPSQVELLKILCKGFNCTQAAKILGIKVKTCQVRSENILRRLEVSSRAQAIVFAMSEGMALDKSQ